MSSPALAVAHRCKHALAALALIGVSVWAAAAAPACSENTILLGSDNGPDASDTGTDAGACSDDAAGGGGSGGDGFGNCYHLQCQQDPNTSVSGVVFDPAGKNPLYNVSVYVPNTPLDPLMHGASCDPCSTPPSAVVHTHTDETGHFVLKNMPVGSCIPLVLQTGKWRRQVVIPVVAQGIDTLLDASMTHLPRNQQQGDLPQIALVTGGCDPLECLLRKIGIDDAEFTGPDQAGRVHLFTGNGGAYVPGSADSTELYSQLGRLSQHDVTLLGCECGTHSETKPAASLVNLLDYANSGGKVFMSHYHYYWIENGPAPFPTTASWEHVDGAADGGPLPQSIVASVDNSFEKGRAFSNWLFAVGASPTPGELPIRQPRKDVKSVATPPSQRWVYYDGSDMPGVQFYSFNTPVDDAGTACGRVFFTDFHVASGDMMPQQQFPTGCATTDMSPQEKALEFMLFDLSACVGPPDAGPGVQ